jgi:hypothetical protein
MSIKQHLQNALVGIKADKDRAVGMAKEKAMRESIIPKHTEINKARDEAIAKITEHHNAKVAELQEHFNAEKQEIVAAAEKKKTEVTNSMIECSVATVNVEYDKAIATLEKQIAEAEE